MAAIQAKIGDNSGILLIKTLTLVAPIKLSKKGSKMVVSGD